MDLSPIDLGLATTGYFLGAGIASRAIKRSPSQSPRGAPTDERARIPCFPIARNETPLHQPLQSPPHRRPVRVYWRALVKAIQSSAQLLIVRHPELQIAPASTYTLLFREVTPCSVGSPCVNLRWHPKRAIPCRLPVFPPFSKGREVMAPIHGRMDARGVRVALTALFPSDGGGSTVLSGHAHLLHDRPGARGERLICCIGYRPLAPLRVPREVVTSCDVITLVLRVPTGARLPFHQPCVGGEAKARAWEEDACCVTGGG